MTFRSAASALRVSTEGNLSFQYMCSRISSAFAGMFQRVYFFRFFGGPGASGIAVMAEGTLPPGDGAPRPLSGSMAGAGL